MPRARVLRPDGGAPDVSQGFGEAVLAALSIDRIVCELLADASRLSTEAWPAFEVPRFEISRGGEQVALLEQTRIRSEVGVVELTVDRVTFGATGSAVVNGVGVRLTPVGGEARGRITVEVNLLITRVNREFAVRATVRGLDTDRPACEMAID